MARLFPWVALCLGSLLGANGCKPQPAAVKVAAPQPMCWRYQSLTAAIAAATIDCQGTIGPNSFKLDNGILVPTFGSCIPGATKVKSAAVTPAPQPGTATPPATAPVAAPALKASAAPPPVSVTTPVPPLQAAADGDVKLAEANWTLLNHLLAFQQLKDMPDIQECLGGRWARWSELFKRTNIATCPTWQKTEIIGDLSPDSIAQLDKMRPKLPNAPATCAEYKSPEERRTCTFDALRQQVKSDPRLAAEQKLANILVPPKTSATYTVSVAPGVECKDAAICAAQCASAFPGFVLAASGSRVDGDATYWLSEAPRGTFPGIQHEMAQFYGPPGELYGHPNRSGELCWRWDEYDELVFLTTLYEVVLAPGVSLSHCGTF
ncbi:MAG: hypothetical protein QM756_01700 [Polyangiaceae bacterium]